MTAPGPVPGADNPFVLAYQTRQFPYTKDGDPDTTVFDSLSEPPASGVAARDAVRYDPANPPGPYGSTG